jgi:hypothetical protein
MTNLYPYFPIVAALIVGGIALYVRHKTRTQPAKDAFGVFIRKQISELPEKNIKAFYTHSKPKIREACDDVWHALPSQRRESLDRLWKEYDEMPEAHLSEERENEYGTTLEEDLREAGDGVTPEHPGHPRDVLKYYLDEFYKFSA